MSDNLRYYGFRPRMPRLGEDPKPEQRRIASAYSSAISGTPDVNAGDPMMLVNDGTLAHCTAGSGTLISHVVVGFGPYWDGSFMKFDNRLPAGLGAYGTNYARETFVWALPVAGIVFEVDCDDNTTATTYATYRSYIGENCDHSWTSGSYGNGTGGFPQLDISTHNTTNTLQWRIVDVAQEVNLDYTGQYVKMLVVANVVSEAPYYTTGT